MKCIRSHYSNRSRRILIGAGEVSYIHKRAEIGMADRIDKFFHALCVLRKEPVILNTGLNSFGRSIFRHFTICPRKYGKDIVKAAAVFFIVGISGCGIMAHKSTSVRSGNINSAFYSFYLGVRISAAAVKEIAADTEANRLNADLLAVTADITRMLYVCFL